MCLQPRSRRIFSISNWKLLYPGCVAFVAFCQDPWEILPSKLVRFWLLRLLPTASVWGKTFLTKSQQRWFGQPDDHADAKSTWNSIFWIGIYLRIKSEGKISHESWQNATRAKQVKQPRSSNFHLKIENILQRCARKFRGGLRHGEGWAFHPKPNFWDKMSQPNFWERAKRVLVKPSCSASKASYLKSLSHF